MRALRSFAAVLAGLLLFHAAPALAQQSSAVVVATCGTPPATYSAGANRAITQDTTGTLCTKTSGGGGGDATAANQVLQITQETAINTVLGTVTASPTANTIADRLKVINTTLGSPFQAGGSIGNTTFASTQSGTWTVQPGNTANTTPWLFTINDGTNSASVAASGADGASNALTGLRVYAREVVYNGSTWDRVYAAAAAAGTTGTGVPSAGLMAQYNTTFPTLTNGQYGVGQLTTRGALTVQLYDGGTGANITGNTTDGVGAANAGLVTDSFTRGFNGTTWDRSRTIQGVDGTGLGVMAVAPAPMSNTNGAISNTTPAGNAPTTVAASALVACSAACNGYKVEVTTGGSAGYVLVFDATSAPADGTVTPTACFSVAATTSTAQSLGQADIPARFATGLTVVFSTTGCFTKTASATAFIRVLAK